MTPSRAVLIGSAVPLVVLVGLATLPSARSALGLSTGAGSLSASPASSPARTSSSSATTSSAQARAVLALRRSITAGRNLTFTGTQVVNARHADGTGTSQVLDVVQVAGGRRTATVHDAGSAAVTEAPEAAGAALAGVSERSLAALAAAYELRPAYRDEIAGRPAVVVSVSRSGRLAARLWLDDATGLLLREDVLDDAGGLRRMSAFRQLRVTTGSVPVGTRAAPPSTQAAGPAWTDQVTAAERERLRAAGWPCPEALADGYTLLDARRSDRGTTPVVHLTYGDGLDAISVFLERGRLDAGQLTGLREERWGADTVHVRSGWPEVIIWQGAGTVVTAMGDAQPNHLRSALAALPRQREHGTLDSLQHAVGSALARLAR